MSDPSEPNTPGSNLPLPFNASAALPAMRQPPPPVYYAEEDEGLPLEPTRTVELETDEATWLSLDISPDGETIVYGYTRRLSTLFVVDGLR